MYVIINKKNSKYKPNKPYKQHKNVITPKLDDNYNYIDITYPKEIADIFRREYEYMLEEIDNKLLECEVGELVELRRREKQIQKELKVFNYWNRE